MNSRQIHTIAILFLLCLFQFYSLLPAFYGSELVGDDHSIHMAEISQLVQSLQVGDWNFWNAGANAGYPSAYYYQALPQMVTAAAINLLSPTFSFLEIYKFSLLIFVILFPLSVYFSIRYYAQNRNAALFAAVIVPIVHSNINWGIGYDGIFSYGLFTQAWACFFIPLSMLANSRYISSGMSLFSSVLWTCILAFCNPLFALFSSVFAAFWIDFTNKKLFSSSVRRLLILATLIALSLSPFLATLIFDSNFYVGFERVNSERGWAFSKFISYWMNGKFFDGEQTPWLSFLFFLSLTSIAVSNFSKKLRSTEFNRIAIYCAFLILLCIGGSYLDNKFTDLIPVTRLIVSLQISLGILLAVQLAFLSPVIWSWRHLLWKDRRRVSFALFSALIFCSIIYSFYQFQNQSRESIRTLNQLTHLHPKEIKETFEFLKSHEFSGRILNGKKLDSGNHWLMYLPSIYANKHSLRAFGAAPQSSTLQFDYLKSAFNPARHTQLYKADVAIIGKHPKETPFNSQPVIFKTKDKNLSVVELPKSNFFEAIEVTSTQINLRKPQINSSIKSWLRSPDSLKSRHILYGDDQSTPTNFNVKILEESYSPSEFTSTIQVNGNSASTILLKTSYHPGWKAYVNRKVTKVLRVSPDFPAIVLPPGTHEVKMKFIRPWYLKLSAAFTLLSILLAYILTSTTTPSGTNPRSST